MWRLEDEDTTRLFTHKMEAGNDYANKADDVQKKWLLIKETWLKGYKLVCGMTKALPRHKQTWWSNRDVEDVVSGSKRHSQQAMKLSQYFGKLLCKLCPHLPPRRNGVPIYRFWGGMPAMRIRCGWLALLLMRAGDVETNPCPTTTRKQ